MYKSLMLVLALTAAAGPSSEAARTDAFASDLRGGGSLEVVSFGDKLSASELCADAARTQERRCRTACPGGAYVFDSGICGIGSKCMCDVSTEAPSRPGVP